MTTSKYYDDDHDYEYKKPEEFIRKNGDIVLYKGKKWFIDDTRMISRKGDIRYHNNCICLYTIKRINKGKSQVEEICLYNDEIESLQLVATNSVKYVKFEKE